MSNFIFSLLLFAAAFSCSAQNDLEEAKKEIIGIWEIVSYKPATISALTEEQSQEYIGKRITFGTDHVTYFGNINRCRPAYQARKEEILSYLYDFRASRDILPADYTSIIILNVICNEERYMEIMYLNPNEFVKNMDGVFFFFKKIK